MGEGDNRSQIWRSLAVRRSARNHVQLTEASSLANLTWGMRVNPSDTQITAALPPDPVPPRPRSRFWAIAIQLAITWVVYVLAIGPLYWQWYQGKYVSGPTLIAAFYEPLWLMCGWFPPLGHFVNWYVRFWIL